MLRHRRSGLASSDGIMLGMDITLVTALGLFVLI
jgi:hypothetical protein